MSKHRKPDPALPFRDKDKGSHFVGELRDLGERKQPEEMREGYALQLQALAEASVAIHSALSVAEVVRMVTETPRQIIGAHLAATSFTKGENWSQAIQHVSLSEKYTAWRDYNALPDGSGIYSLVCRTNHPLRLKQAELASHPAWRGFGAEAGAHPPLRGLLAAPLVGRDGQNIGLIQLSDRYEGEFTAADEAILVQLAQTAAQAIENARLYEQVHSGRERLQALSRQLVEIQEDERRAVARELHDEIGQLLTALKLVLDVGQGLPPALGQDKLGVARALVGELTERVRELSLDLRPAALDSLGLLPALLGFFERYSHRTGVRVQVTHLGLDRRFNPKLETAVYRLVQESLTNVARHAGVTEATVWLWADRHALLVQVADQGSGFDAPALLAGSTSSGLPGMCERVLLLGGQLTVDSAAGSGTQLTAEFPLDEESEVRSQQKMGNLDF